MAVGGKNGKYCTGVKRYYRRCTIEFKMKRFNLCFYYNHVKSSCQYFLRYFLKFLYCTRKQMSFYANLTKTKQRYYRPKTRKLIIDRFPVLEDNDKK